MLLEGPREVSLQVHNLLLQRPQIKLRLLEGLLESRIVLRQVLGDIRQGCFLSTKALTRKTLELTAADSETESCRYWLLAC
jgi:hypothetical protein